MIELRNAAAAPPTRDAPPHVFARILAAIDFSSASLAATRWATAHVARQSRAVLAHIIAAPRSLRGDGHLDRTELRERLAEVPALRGGLGGFAATLELAAARLVVRLGRASHWLSLIAAESEASLLVLGRRVDSNRRGVGEANVLERSARRTNASVLVVPEGATAPPRHVVAAIDHSPISSRVLDVAGAIARLSACDLSVIHVDGPGHPAREIMDAVRDLDAPLIVAGKRGDDGAPVGSIGSVARGLLSRAPVPVLAIDGGA